MHACRNVNPPNQVAAFDALCEVQSDKASVEITSPFDGIVKDILVREGGIAKVGEGLCVIEVDEDEYPSSEETQPSSTPPEREVTLAREPSTGKPEPPPQEAPKAQRRPHPLDPNVGPGLEIASRTNAENVLATPSVRHFARQKGVDLAKLAPGSGKGGRIEKRDVEVYLNGPPEQTAVVDTKAPSQAGPLQDTVVELGRTRYGMWKAMVKVCHIAPDLFSSADLSIQSLEIPHFGRVFPHAAYTFCGLLTTLLQLFD